MNDLLLLPVPLHCERTGGEIESANLAVHEVIDPSAVRETGEEAYHLVIDAGGARIAARTATGLRWGRATLDQLRGVRLRPSPSRNCRLWIVTVRGRASP